MILLVDNYDSFSYNLYQLAGSINPDMKVIRNDEMTIDEICALAPASIILSPGPGRPEQAGRCMEIVEKLGGEIPILGVCLGHQAICAAYGATVTYAKQLMHGKQSETTLDLTSELFQGLPETVPVARYHSLAADEATLPETLKVTARTADGEVMAVEDREKKIYGTQDYQYLLDLIDKKAKETGEEIQVFQSNHEGAIIDRIQEAYSDGTEGIVINPGAYTHYSYAIRDALASVDIPKVEIHISDITSREEFRKISVTAPVCNRQIYGQALDGYLQAIDFLRENRQ